MSYDQKDYGLSQVEPDDVNVGMLGIVGAMIAVALLLVGLLLQAWFYDWKGKTAAAQAVPVRAPETPLGLAFIDQQAEINNYRWINREAGIRAIPIDRAMDLVVKEMSATPAAAKK